MRTVSRESRCERPAPCGAFFSQRGGNFRSPPPLCQPLFFRPLFFVSLPFRGSPEPSDVAVKRAFCPEGPPERRSASRSQVEQLVPVKESCSGNEPPFLRFPGRRSDTYARDGSDALLAFPFGLQQGRRTLVRRIHRVNFLFAFFRLRTLPLRDPQAPSEAAVKRTSGPAGICRNAEAYQQPG